MNREQLLELHKTLTEQCRAIMEAKNHDYAGGKDEPFANFMASRFLSVEPEIGLLIRCMDKFKRIEAFVNKGELKVKGESVMDAIKDVINYMVLLAGMIEGGSEDDFDTAWNAAVKADADEVQAPGGCFAWVHKWVERGYLVRRKAWPAGKTIHRSACVFSLEDMLAEDWEVVS